MPIIWFIIKLLCIYIIICIIQISIFKNLQITNDLPYLNINSMYVDTVLFTINAINYGTEQALNKYLPD